MAWKILIHGDDRTSDILAVGGASIRLPLNERKTAQFSLAPGESADVLDPVAIYAQDGITLLFGGIIYSRSMTGVGAFSTLACECVDYSIYAEWHYIDLILVDQAEPSPSRTLKYILQQIVATMAADGVTLAAGQVDGPDIEAFDWELVRVSDALSELVAKTGYEITWSPSKVLEMVPAGSAGFPSGMTMIDTNMLSLSWDESIQGYATKVYVVCGPEGAAETWQEWVGDGTTHEWTTSLRSIVPYPTYVEETVVSGGTTVVNNRTISSNTSYRISSSTASPAAIAITGITEAAQTEVTCASAHSMLAGDTVSIAGDSKITTGLYPITFVSGATKFTIAFTVADNSGARGTARHATTTVTTAKDHDFAPADTVVVSAHNAVPSLNGTRTVLATPTSTTFTIAKVITTAGTATGAVKESNADYFWNNADHTLAVDHRAEGIPGADTTLRLFYTGRFPFTVYADSHATPVVTYRTTATDIVTVDAGQQLADGLLAAMYQRPLTMTWTSLAHGWTPGQVGDVVSVLRDQTRRVVITNVDITLISDTFWSYTIAGSGLSASDATLNPTSSSAWALNYFRQIGGGGGSTSATIGMVSGGTTGGGGGSTYNTFASPCGLGGSRGASIPMAASPAYTPVLDWVPFVSAVSFSARVRVSLWARTAGVSVTARLRNTTDGTTVGTSAAVTSTTATETTFLAAVVAGKAYRLEVIGGTASESVYAIGTVEGI